MSMKFTNYWLLFWVFVMFGSAIHALYHNHYIWMGIFIFLTICDGVIFYKIIKQDK